jgi:hypothetical protein
MEHFKQSSVDRIVGSASAEDKLKVVTEFEETSRNQDVVIEEYRKHEINKEKEDDYLFELALSSVNAERARLSMPLLRYTKDNFHIASALRDENGKHAGFFSTIAQQIWIQKTDESLLGDIKKITHELIHAAGYNVLQLDPSKERDQNLINTYRSGLFMQQRATKVPEGVRPKELFRNFNEAITEELTKRIMKKYKDPLLEKYQDELRRECPNELDEPDELAFISSGILGEYVLSFYGYKPQREIYNKLYQKLYLMNESRFTSVESIKDMAIDTAITGNIIPFAKLVEKTFGKGTFRKLGEVDSDIQKLKYMVDLLEPSDI